MNKETREQLFEDLSAIADENAKSGFASCVYAHQVVKLLESKYVVLSTCEYNKIVREKVIINQKIYNNDNSWYGGADF